MIVEVTEPAGSAFLFDTSGIHRQGTPILQPRYAVFFNYHDPTCLYKRKTGILPLPPAAA
jgi:hypothetical protein